jgi:pimeloyl-ACP methyl ester carboxylesterase
MKNLRERDGRLYWHWDPQFLSIAAGDRGRGDGRLERAAAGLRAPTLLVRGSRSDIVTPEDVEAFLSLVPGAEFVEVAGAAHMVAGDENTAFGGALLGFLERIAPPIIY